MGKGKADYLKATDLTRKIWRTAGKCEAGKYCKSKVSSPQLQGAHIFGVGAYPRLRDDLRNGLSLCATCHRVWTSAPLDFTEFIQKTKYKKYIQPLRDKSNAPKQKIFWNERLQELKDIHDRILEGELTLDEAREYET